LAAILAGARTHAQYITFGKNKVSYREFEWRELDSAHFALYYYPEEEELAHLALAEAERSYAHHRAAFAHDVSEPIPIILYSSHQDFQQTNVTPGFIPEGVAGLTETIRGRVLMPFDGSPYRFLHTLRHELVHAFQLSMTKRAVRERYRRRMAPHPLWFTEGLAEHWSARWDPDGDMVMRDLVISGDLPPIREFWRYHNTFAMYKIGQSMLDFIAQTYGDDKLIAFYTDAWKARRFTDLFPHILGVTEGELSSRWMHWLRERYYPDVTEAEPILHSANRVGVKGHVLKPTPVPAGIAGFEKSFIFISPHSGYANIYAASWGPEKCDPKVLVKGQRSPEFLSFHSFRSRMDVSAAGLLVFSSQSGPQDVLMAYDLAGGGIVGQWGFPDLVGITSPHWDRDGRRICFSGLSCDGRSDLYLFDTQSCHLERLTTDRFYDADPAFHPDGECIAFVSDRGARGREGALNLHLYDLHSGNITPLTAGLYWDLSPSWSPDGQRLLFTSSRSGMRDLYLVDRTGRGRRLTRSLEALLDPRWLPSGQAVLATAYHFGRMEAVVVPLDAAAADSIDFRETVPPDSAQAAREPLVAWSWDAEVDSVAVGSGNYGSGFALDVAQGGVAVAPGLGAGEGVQILLRDLMGNRLIFMQLANTTISTESFLDNFSAGFTYYNVSRRLNRGFSLFHHAGTYYDELDLPFFQRRAGASLLLSYPLSRFARVETHVGLAYSEKEKPIRGQYRYGVMATHYVSWIHDTSLWLPTGPIDGDRCHLTAGLMMNLDRPGVESMLLLADARRYLRLGSRSAVALRMQARISGGPDPQTFLLGGSHSLRGYDWRALHGTRALLLNGELRFPVVRGFMIFPVGVGALGFPGIQGAVFCDAGEAWDGDRWPREWRGSYGLGLRMGLGGVLVLRFDLARRTDFSSWPSKTHREFFVGWNY
jgi:hypothetical protein